MRILISGGAGFLGRHFCAEMLKQGHEVLCLDNLLTGRRENIEGFGRGSSFRFILQDVTAPFQIEEPLDAVVHMACPASPPDYLRFPIQTLEVGTIGTRNLLALALEKNARFLLTSTSEVYGDPKVSPQTENYWGNVNPIGPRSVYDEAKRASEALTMAYHRRHGLDTRIARIFNTYGPWMRASDGRVVSNFIVQALQGKELTVYGDGSQTRSFCYVSDLIDGLIRLLLAGSDSPVAGAQTEEWGIHYPVNVGNPREEKIVDIAQIITKMTASSSPVSFHPLPTDDPKVRRPDISRARHLLGWEPKVTLEDGLASTISYFQECVGGGKAK
ncbi:MAG TPA: UDP-glucuronic acid decarboxylase family protein [Terriglobia bacterium]|nr:UDP-glucuronic acid decarboxylase family protein [Terriglobia bacterium]